MKKIIIIVFSFFLIHKTCADTTRVLFIGNSYTYVNNLPLLFKNFSETAGETVYTDLSAPGGYTLQLHLENPETLNLITLGNWDYLVLQEQSQIPVIDYLRYYSMYPSLCKLDTLIRNHNHNALIFLFMTWGRKYGGQQCIDTFCSPVFINFFQMQDALKTSYYEAQNITSAYIAPIGEAWRIARMFKPDVNLWDSDNSHPTLDGSYLAACVLYAKIFQKSPISVFYNPGLPDSSAFYYRVCAFQAVNSIATNNLVSENFELFQNFPNPFNSSTEIKFSLPKSSIVSLKIYDLLGREVITLFDKFYPEGNHSFLFSNSQLPSGIYFYRLQSDKYSQIKKLVIIK